MTANLFMAAQNVDMVANTIAVIHDARFLVVLSTIRTVLFFVLKLFKWLADNFHAIPDKTEGQQIMPVAYRNPSSQVRV